MEPCLLIGTALTELTIFICNNGTDKNTTKPCLLVRTALTELTKPCSFVGMDLIKIQPSHGSLAGDALNYD